MNMYIVYNIIKSVERWGTNFEKRLFSYFISRDRRPITDNVRNIIQQQSTTVYMLYYAPKGL
jgi:hypothetical protein